MIKNLTSLRFIFVMLVFVNHFLGSIIPQTFSFGGECGVAFFFVLSGFVLSVGYGRKVEEGTFSVRSFFFRHLKKLYPLHFLTLAAMLVLNWRMGIAPNPGPTLAQLFLVQTWIPLDDFVFYANATSWFLCDILFFYLVFAVLYRWLIAASHRQLLLVGTVVLCAYFSLAFLLPKNYVDCFLYAHPVLRCLDFMIGILTYRLYRSFKSHEDTSAQTDRQINPCVATFMELTVVALFVLLAVVYEHCDVALRSASLFWPFVPATILFFAWADRQRGILTRLLHARPIMWLGNVSFEIYMLHLLVFRVVQHYAVRFLPDVGEVTGAWRMMTDSRYLALLAVDFTVTLVLAATFKWIFSTIKNKL